MREVRERGRRGREGGRRERPGERESLTNLIGTHVLQSVQFCLLPLQLHQHLVRQLLPKLPERMLEGPQLVVHTLAVGEESGGHDRPSFPQSDLKETTDDAACILEVKGQRLKVKSA